MARDKRCICMSRCFCARGVVEGRIWGRIHALREDKMKMRMRMNVLSEMDFGPEDAGWAGDAA